MKLFLKKITSEETFLHFTQEDLWLLNAIKSIDEKPTEILTSHESRSISANISLREVDKLIIVSGRIETPVELICSRCINHYIRSYKFRFSSLFCQDPEMAGIAYLKKENSKTTTPQKPEGKIKGFARHVHDTEHESLALEGKDLDITYLSEDYINLADVFTEQLQLQIPFQPLCKEICQGICSECGTDLNSTHCQCQKKNPKTSFSVLKDFNFQKENL